MAPPFACASVELDYPIYAVDFDPDDARRLVVGGGGGAGRSGVGNKITVLETPEQGQLRVAGDIDLSRDEDSVMSLVVPARSDGGGGKSTTKKTTTTTTTRVLAGVNSSPADMAKGINLHLRAFSVSSSKSSGTPKKRSGTSVTVAETSRTALFANPDQDTYQRLLRVAGSLGVAASAMGKDPQIAVFDVAAAQPKLRGLLELPRDAEDLDVLQTGPGEYQVAFCYRHELHLVAFGKEKGEPQLVFTMPDDHGRRPVFRAIRFLTPDFLLAAANLPGRSGVLLQGFRLPSPGHEKARIAVTARIPRKIAATALAVTNLSPPSRGTTAAAAAASTGSTQFVVAVAGHDSSISLYTLEHRPSTTLNLLVDLHPLRTLTGVHGAASITDLALSGPVIASATSSRQTKPSTPMLRLASTSLQKTVAMHTIPLRKVTSSAAEKSVSAEKSARFVVAMRSQRPSSRPLVVALTVIVLILAVIGQAVMEAYGRSQPLLFSARPLSSWHGALLRNPPLSSDVPAAIIANELLKRLAGAESSSSSSSSSSHVVAAGAAGEAVVLFEAAPSTHDSRNDNDDGTQDDDDDDDDSATVQSPGIAQKVIQMGVHDAAIHGNARSWDELGAEQRRLWKHRLREAGAWTQGMGETVFKGILFGEIAGAIGRAMEG